MTRCRICRTPYERRSMTHVACSAECAAIVAQRKRERTARLAAKADRAATRQQLEALKTRPQLIAEAQAAVNAYVRWRDIRAGHGCIDCGQPFEPDRPGGSVDAGHYLSRSVAPALRFDLDNIHAQRKNCNRPGGATRQAYRAGLVARIGEARVAALEAPTGPAKWTREDLRAIRDKARAMRRAESA
jgi:hypothetical protein